VLLIELGVFLPYSGVRFDSWPSFRYGIGDYASQILVVTAPLLVLSLGMTVVLMTAGIDLSVGSMVALIAAVVSTFDDPAAFWWKAAPVGLAVGLGLGALNGLLIARLDMPPIIATLGTLIFYRGLCSVVLRERENISVVPEWLGSFPGAAIIAAAVVVVVGGYFVRSRFSREVLMLGGNRIAARYAGIPVERRLVQVYTLMGLLAFIAAMSAMAYDSAVNASWQTGLELKVIVAVVLGGTRVDGGKGSVWGSVLGVFLIAVLDDGLRAMHRSDLMLILLGPLLVLGVWLNTHVGGTQRTARSS
jgi:ribose/xylose/arabinose/galactoside ABC-type transport system permease subunit